ncbi:hypothetical protein BJX62DRAFT_112375 [Aspergillus germanicus]
MPRHRPLRNSRHGCLQCKRRGVKCDEKRPTCSKCESRLDACQYGATGPWIWTEPAVPGQSCKDHLGMASASRPSKRDFYAVGKASGAISPSLSTGGLDSAHLRLLLNWTTATALTISRNDVDRPIWQTLVPREAVSNPCLLHGIFAVSALHLALVAHTQDHERKQWISTAEYHQSAAISLFTHRIEKTYQVQHIGSFAISSLLIGWAFAFPLAVSGPDDGPSDPLGEMLQIFTFIKSTMEFSSPILTGPKSAEMRQLTYIEGIDPGRGLSGFSCLAISALYGLNATRILDWQDNRAFHQSINMLKDLFANIDSGAEPVSKTFMWISETPARFHHLLHQRHPFAFVILAHYCVALHHLRRAWWISSWGQNVLSMINRILSPEWRPFMEWALDVTKGLSVF